MRIAFATSAFLALLPQQPFTLPSPGVSPPVLTHSVDPVMPHRFLSGKAHVVVRCVVDVHGMPTAIEVATSGGEKYDKAAVSAVEQYRFSPATKDGAPVPVSLLVDVTFQYGRK